MKKRGIFLIIILFSLALFAVSSSAFYFNGVTYDINKNPLNGTNITLYIYDFQVGFDPIDVVSTLSNISGSFSLWVNDTYTGPNYNIKPVVIHYNSSTSLANYVGQSLPELPGMQFNNLGPINFYLKYAVTLNITAYNSSNALVPFDYQVKDTKLGYPVYNQFSQGDLSTYNALLTVPLDRNYSVMIYPDRSFPLSYDVNNASDYGMGGLVNVKFNTTNTWHSVSGYLDYNGAKNFDGNLTIVPYLLEPGNMIALDHPLPQNMSNLRNMESLGNYTDFFNASDGFYNISLPGGQNNIDIVMFVIVQNKSGDYFGALQNISLDASYNSIQLNVSLDELVGVVKNISVENVQFGPWEDVSVWTKMVNFSLTNGSVVDNYPNNAFIEIEVDYSSYNSIEFSWMLNVEQNDQGYFQVPLLNHSVKRINVYTNEYAPLKTSKTANDLANEVVNITLRNFDPGAIDPAEDFSDLVIDLIKSNPTCDVPNPLGSCSLLPSEVNESDFDPLSVIMGGGKISFVMKQLSTGISVQYVNVDMLASGPPDVMFDPSANNTKSGTSLEQAWRFGSNGPEIYDSVIVSIPYNSTEVDESKPQSILIKYLYDSNWNVIWNATENPNGLNSSYVDYLDFDQRWFNTSSGGMPCQDSSMFDVTVQGCYTNKTQDMNYLVIPHFSGLGPQVQSYVAMGTITSNATVYSCYPFCSALLNVNVTNAGLVGLQTITINNTDTTNSLITYNISYLNNSNGQWVELVGQNNVTIENFNLSLYVNKFRIEPILSTPLSTKWNFTININGTYYTLDPYLDSIALNAPADGETLGQGNHVFNFTLYSTNWTTQLCSLYVNGTVQSTNYTVLNGTLTSLNASLSSSSSWFISCNATGNSVTRTFTIDSTAPVNLSASARSSSVNIGDTVYIDTNWSDSSLSEQNLTCTLYVNGVANQSWSSNGSWCNMTYLTSSADYPSKTFYVTATDKYGNTGTSSIVSVDVNLTCGSVITSDLTLQENLDCSSSGGIGLNLSADGISLNCLGYSITGNGSGQGIYFNNNNYARAYNCFVTNFSSGVYFSSASDCNVSGVFTHNSIGIYDAGTNNLLLNNNMSYNTWGVNGTSTSTTWKVLSRNVIVNSNLSIKGSIRFGSDGVLELRNSYLWFNGTMLSVTGNVTSLGYNTNNITANQSTEFDFYNLTRVNITLSVLKNISAVISVVGKIVNSTPNSSYLSLKAVDILADDTTKGNLSWSYIKIYYSDSELSDASVTESSLKMFYYNETLPGWQEEPNQGVDTSNNFVWANVTHLSLFGVFGTSQSSSSSEESSSSTTSSTTSSTQNTEEPDNEFSLYKARVGEENELKINYENIEKIIFEVFEETKRVKFTIDTYDSEPSGINKIESELYKVFKFSVKNLEDSNIKSAKIKFSVSKSWLQDNNVSDDEIRLFRYNNNKWNQLETEKVSENSNKVYYEALTPGFSYFAIATKVATVEEAEEKPTEEEKPLPALNITEPGNVEEKKPVSKVLVAIVIVLAVVFILILLSKWKYRNIIWREPTEKEIKKTLKKKVMKRMKRQSRGV